MHNTPLPDRPKRTRSRNDNSVLGSLLRATPNHVDHGKMARFFGSMLAGRAAGMRKALFTNGPGIKTLYASTVVGCTGVYWYLQLNSGTRARTQSRTEPKELETKFSYDGWQMDAEFAEEHDIKHPKHPFFLCAILDTMHRKQQVHDGDRSHPFIRKLDALIPTLSYAGWEGDVHEIEWPKATEDLHPLKLDQRVSREVSSHPYLFAVTITALFSFYWSWFSSSWTPRRFIYQIMEKDVDFALALMRGKQAKHESATESSDAKQRRLSDIVIGLERKRVSWLA